jgi:hypothetical protein
MRGVMPEKSRHHWLQNRHVTTALVAPQNGQRLAGCGFGSSCIRGSEQQRIAKRKQGKNGKSKSPPEKLNRYRAEKCKKGRKKTAAPHLATLFVFCLLLSR